MTQPINRETAIALAKEAGMAGMLTDVVCSLEEIHRLCNLAVAHSRKDADKLLQQALEALERATGYLWAGTANGKHPDALADVRLHKKTITAIRTYRENKA